MSDHSLGSTREKKFASVGPFLECNSLRSRISIGSLKSASQPSQSYNLSPTIMCSGTAMESKSSMSECSQWLTQ